MDRARNIESIAHPGMMQGGPISPAPLAQSAPLIGDQGRIGRAAPGLSPETFVRLERQLTLVCSDCNDGQLLDLADRLHEMIRDRRQRHAGRSFIAP